MLCLSLSLRLKSRILQELKLNRILAGAVLGAAAVSAIGAGAFLGGTPYHKPRIPSPQEYKFLTSTYSNLGIIISLAALGHQDTKEAISRTKDIKAKFELTPAQESELEEVAVKNAALIWSLTAQGDVPKELCEVNKVGMNLQIKVTNDFE